jgi:hypothetical protein
LLIFLTLKNTHSGKRIFLILCLNNMKIITVDPLG